MDSQEIKRLLRQWGECWGVASLDARIKVETSKRMSRSLGRCYPKEGRIRLNGALLLGENGKLLREILCHEAAHLATHLLYATRRKPHGPEWRQLVEKAGYLPRVRIPQEEVQGIPAGNNRSRYLYVHQCRDCKTTFRARRTDRRWRCRLCTDKGRRGSLSVTRLRA